MSNVLFRLSSLAVGIVLARLLAPEEFGIYAVALTVQAILMTVADLGLSADLVRTSEPERRAPTVASLGLLSGTTLAVVSAATSAPVARALGSPESAPVIVVLSLTLALAGAGVVPFAMLQRRFMQKQLFLIAVVDFCVSTPLTLFLVLADWGAMSLAVGRVVAQSISLGLQFYLSGTRPRIGLDRGVLRSVLRFGLPVAGANMLSWAVLTVDNAVIANMAGATALGLYVLAFNISSWPMTLIGQVIRSVALPGFARADARNQGRSLADGLAFTWALALPAGAFLAVLSTPIIALLYGRTWASSAPVLAALGIFGAIRVVFDLFASYLLARASTRAVLTVQLVWMAALVPVLVWATGAFGIVGAGWAHVAVATFVGVPAYLVALRGQGADLRAMAWVVVVPLLAVLPAGLAAHVIASTIDIAGLAVLVGGLVGTGTYAALIYPWLVRRLSGSRLDPLPPTTSAHAPEIAATGTGPDSAASPARTVRA